MAKILVVDDEPNIVELLKLYLRGEGYQVETASNGKEAAAKMASTNPDLVILDLMLPDADGFQICREFRAKSDLPILMLTARREDIDKIVGLEVGADDYLTKPFNPRELIARIKAVLRRYQGGLRSKEINEAGNLRIDRAAHEAFVNEKAISLRNKEFTLLSTFMQNIGILLSREKLLELVWGFDYYGESRTVDVHVNHLREKLTGAEVSIETVRGAGYRMSRREPPL